MAGLSGNIIRWSSGSETLQGYSAGEIIGHHFSCFLSPQDIAEGKPAYVPSAAAAAGHFDEEGLHLRRDGSRFGANAVISAGHDGTGAVDGYAEVVRDISERRRMEARLRQVVEAAPNAMVMISGEGIIEMVNAQTERVFGYPRGEMLGQSVEMLVPERFRAAHPGLRGAFFRDPRSRPMGAGRDLFALRKDGSEFPVEIGLNPIDTDEGPMVLSAIVDISDRKHREEGIRAALREKDVLLGEIHHRVKNNLQIVHSLLDLQSARITDPVVREILRVSQNRIRSMALIHQTLYGSKDFAKVDFGAFLGSLVPTLIGSYGVAAERIKLSVDLEPIELPIDSAVPCGLVVNELISNALKHAFHAGQDGELIVRLKHHATNEVTLDVADNGRGLSDDFDTANTSRLGLQLVTLLTDQLGGDLTIHRSKPTKFVLRFPIER